MSQEKIRVTEEIDAASHLKVSGQMRGNDTVADQSECWLLVSFYF